MLKRAILVAASLVLLTASAAAAQQYPPAVNSLTLSPGSAAPGSQVTATAQSFEPGSTVSFELNGVLGTATADASGVATLTFTVPDLAPGEYTVTATGTGADGEPLTVESTLTVLAPGAAGDGGAVTGGEADGAADGGLADTGQSGTGSLTRLGAALLAFGGIAVLTARKRRAAATPEPRVAERV